MGVLESNAQVISFALIVALVIICFLLLFLKGGKERSKKRWEEQERKWQEERQKAGDLFVKPLLELTKNKFSWEKGLYAFCTYYDSVWVFLFIDPYDSKRKWVHTYEMDRTIRGPLVEELAELLISQYGPLPKKELPKGENK